MTKDEIINLKKLIIHVADYYSKELNPEVVSMMAQDLEDLPFESVVNAYNKYRKEDRIMKFPMPSQIRDIVSPKIDSKELAIHITRKIDKAILKHGWNWEQGYFGSDGIYWESNGKKFNSFKEALIEEIGDIGYHSICLRGGWSSVCQSSNEMDEGQYYSQMRELIQSSINLSKQGVDVTRINMPTKNNDLTSPKEILKLITNV